MHGSDVRCGWLLCSGWTADLQQPTTDHPRPSFVLCSLPAFRQRLSWQVSLNWKIVGAVALAGATVLAGLLVRPKKSYEPKANVPASTPTYAHTNRLVREKSPYLLQHAHNPVDWYPWGAEAFTKAHQDNKPILLSIGYSTCHWCHVMERESFEDETTARFLNE